jgi:tRNA1Val (adenine37-N6)-methyltransferase
MIYKLLIGAKININETMRIIFTLMANDYFEFKEFIIYQGKSPFKVGTDGVILGASADVAGVRNILDIGAGTGLISIMLAQRSAVTITAIEPDLNSFGQLKDNVSICKWKGRIETNCTRLQDYHPGIKFDLIVSNPPYFTDSLRNPDPSKASARHNYSLPPIEMLGCVSELLENEGRFEVIMPFPEGNVFIAEAAMNGLYCNKIVKIKPLPNSEIRRIILTFSRQKLKPSEKFLVIERGARHEFTEEYINLTKDFYLKF